MLVKPAITGCGRNLTNLPSRKRPIITCIRPAKAPAKKQAAYPMPADNAYQDRSHGAGWSCNLHTTTTEHSSSETAEDRSIETSHRPAPLAIPESQGQGKGYKCCRSSPDYISPNTLPQGFHPKHPVSVVVPSALIQDALPAGKRKAQAKSLPGPRHHAWTTPTGLAVGFGHPSCPTWHSRIHPKYGSPVSVTGIRRYRVLLS